MSVVETTQSMTFCSISLSRVKQMASQDWLNPTGLLVGKTDPKAGGGRAQREPITSWEAKNNASCQRASWPKTG